MERFCFLIIIFFSITVVSQKEKRIHQSLVPEKIYLQLDTNVYANDQDIWFKAVVVSAETHKPSKLSRVLYVDLIGPDEKLLEQKLVRIDGGVGNNFFKLQKKYPKGRYLIRAYTEWNRNFRKHFIFKAYVHIFPTEKSKNSDPIKKFVLVKNESGKDTVKVQIDPLQIDSLQKRKLKVYLAFKKQKDTITVKKNREQKYELAFPVPDSTDIAALTVETENGVKFRKTVSLNNNPVDIQFFPESGKMLYGHINRIGFKALDHLGKGIKVSGKIIDQNNTIINNFKSSSLGMGIFAFRPIKGNRYYAELTLSSGEIKKYPLPKASEKGSVLSILDRKDKIAISVFSNELISQQVLIRVACRGIAYYEMEGKLKDGLLVTYLPKEELPDGILVFTLMDKNQKPLAERLYFNESQDNRLKLKLSTDTLKYSQRQKTKLSVEVIDGEKDSVSYNCSVLIVNKELLGKGQNRKQNILSYLLLDSELRGNIENPSYYFDDNNKTRTFDLDALLLTQGWRNYKYNNHMPRNNFSHKNEPALSISGRIGVPFSKIKKEGMKISMMVFGEQPSFYSQQTDSLGYFDFQLADTFGERAKILVQNNDEKGKKKNYPIVLTKKKTPKIEYEYRPTVRKLDSTIQVIAQKKRDNKRTIDAYDRLNGLVELDEVVVTERKLTPLQKEVTEKYGEADVVIKGEEIKAKEKKWSYGLYSVLLFNYPEEIEIEQFPDGFMLAHVVGDKEREATLIMIDGKLVNDFNYSLIPSIPPSEVKSVELIKYTKRFKTSFLEVFPNISDPRKIPLTGHIISIYTHGNVGLHGISEPKGQFQTSIPVFSATKEFYAPKYETKEEIASNKPDLGSLVYWKPSLNVVRNKKASVEFYNGDDLGKMLVIVEAVSENGKIGYQELTYTVD